MSKSFWITKRVAGTLLILGWVIIVIGFLVVLAQGTLEGFRVAWKGVEGIGTATSVFATLETFRNPGAVLLFLGFGVLTLHLREAGNSASSFLAFNLFIWVYGRSDSTVNVMGANIYPEDIEQSLYAEPNLAAVTNSFCLSLEEGSEGSVRPRLSFEVRSDIKSDLQAEFEDRMIARLVDLNADFREAMDEHREMVTPKIELHPLGAGPFSKDGDKIKQTRILS